MTMKQQKSRLTVSFHAEKLKMLDYCMKEKGADLEQTLVDFIGGLYEKHVPKIMKGFIEIKSGNDTVHHKNQTDTVTVNGGTHE